MALGYGTYHWYAVPGDPVDGDLIARELGEYVRVMGEVRRERTRRETETALQILTESNA